MTTTLILSTLAGAAVSYPLLNRIAQMQQEKLQLVEQWGDKILFCLNLLIFALPFLLYPPSFALVIVVAALLTGAMPILVIPILIGVFLVMGFSVLWFLIIIPAIIVILVVMIKNHELVKWQKFSVQYATVFAAAGVILSEFALLSAMPGHFFDNNAELISWMGGKRAIPALTLMLNKPDDGFVLDQVDDSYNSSVATHLDSFGKDVVPALLKNIDSLNGDAQGYALRKIQAYGAWTELQKREDKGVFVLINGLSLEEQAIHQGTNGVKKIGDLAAENLINIGAPAVPKLLAALKEDRVSDYKHTNIIFVLRQIAGMQVLPEIIATFKARKYAELSECNVKFQQELAAFGEEAIPIFIGAMSSEDEWQRWWCREALVKMGKPAVLPLLKAMTLKPSAHDKSLRFEEQAQREAIVALAELKEISAVPGLMELLQNDTLRDKVIWALRVLEDDRAIPALIVQYRRTHEREIIEAIGGIGGEQAEKFLHELMRHGVRSARFDALGIMDQAYWVEGEKSEIGSLVRGLNSVLVVEIEESAEQLGNIGEPVVLTFLEEADARMHSANKKTQKNGCKVCIAIRKLKDKE